MEDTLKERFDLIITNTVPGDLYSMLEQAYNLALSESKQLRYDYEAAVLRVDELEKECELLKYSVASLHSELHECANNPNYLYTPRSNKRIEI